MTEAMLALVGLRISQLNGCGCELYGHHQSAKQAGETEERLVLIAAWRDAPFFTDAERAALDLAEWITLRASAPPRIWARAVRCHTPRELLALLVTIVTVNLTQTVHSGQKHRATRNPLGSNIFFQDFRNSP